MGPGTVGPRGSLFGLLVLGVLSAGCATTLTLPAERSPAAASKVSEEAAIERALNYLTDKRRFDDADATRVDAVFDDGSWLVRVRKSADPGDYYVFSVDARTGRVSEVRLED